MSTTRMYVSWDDVKVGDQIVAYHDTEWGTLRTIMSHNLVHWVVGSRDGERLSNPQNTIMERNGRTLTFIVNREVAAPVEIANPALTAGFCAFLETL